MQIDRWFRWLNWIFFSLTQQFGWQIISPQVHFTGYKPSVWPLLSVMFHCYCGLILSTLSHFFHAHPHARCSSEHGRRITGKFQCEQIDTKRLRGRLFDWDRGVKPIRNGRKEQRQEIRCHFTAVHHQIWSRFLHSIAKMGTRQSVIFFFTPFMFCFINRWINKGLQSDPFFSSFRFSAGEE